ncbi:MAG TPA: undecaprenyl-diphosphate phosphatase [Firmicutes bacterium]|nr:undecaprenyl-diphosphate phosphatase [Bacillota bacterium]
MTISQAIVLGIVQGLTEFLPVSSSGHLVLFSELFGVQTQSLVFEVTVHVGTLLAVLAVFWGEVKLLFASLIKLLRSPKQAKTLLKDDPGCRLLLALVLGTLPAVLVALILKEQVERLFSSTLFTAVMLLVTGAILYAAEKRSAVRGRSAPSYADALVIGCGQAAAILPGLSRSGTTIAVGLFRGLDRESAARFSFLLSMPAILGGLVLSLIDLVSGTAALEVGALVAGLVSAAITGYLAIRFFLGMVRRGKLVWFSYYTWLVGAAVIIVHLL